MSSFPVLPTNLHLVLLKRPDSRLQSIFSLQRLRRFSSTHPTYPSKVRAFPFAISKNEAITLLGPYASLTCLFKNFFHSLAASFFGSGFTPIQPAQIQAVYLPSWFVDAELKARAWVTSKNETTQRAVTAAFINSYMPGFHWEPLSRISFNRKAMHLRDPIPFSEHPEGQHDGEILHIPYSLSPLSLPDILHTLDVDQAIVSDDLRILPNTITTKFLAAYPVLIPIYLARYELELLDQKHQVTLVLEAFSNNGRVICDMGVFFQIQEQLKMSSKLFEWLYSYSEFVIFRKGELMTPFAEVNRFMAPLHRKQLAMELGAWLNALIKQPHTLNTFADLSSPDLDDPRVREFAKEEVQLNRGYISMGMDILTMKTMIENISRADSRVVHIGIGRSAHNPKASLEDIVAGLEGKRQAIKPQWWTDWENDAIKTRVEH